MKFDHKKFFDGFKANFDASLDQGQVDGIEFLLTQFEQDPLWDKTWKIAYGFATTYHETAGSMQPVEEAYYLEQQYSKAVMLKTQKGFRYYPYFGRGYPQTTWLTNYKRADKELRKQRPEVVAQFEAETGQTFDLVNHPEQMKQPLIAFATMTLGMAQGWFTGKKLTDFAPTNYYDMRTIINGHDKATLIAGYARIFEKILKESAAVESKPVRLTSDVPSIETSEPPPDAPQVGTAGDPNSQPPPQAEGQTIVDVPPVQTEPPEGIISKIKTWYAALPAFLLSVLGGFWSWLQGAATEIIVAFLVTAGIVAIAFILTNFLSRRKDKQLNFEAQERQRERDFELTKLQLLSAMDPNKQTVRVAPPPVVVPTPPDGVEA